MRLTKILLILFSVFSFSMAAFAGEVNFPTPTGFVNDFAGILTADQKQALEQISQSLKQTNGAELAIAIVDSVEPLDSKLYAVKLFEKWKIGEKDNGVLVLLAMKERRIEIEVGYGLEGVLTDALAGQILDDYAMPSFKEGKMGEGVIATAKAIASVVVKEANAPKFHEKTGESGGQELFFIFILIGVILIGIYGAAKDRPLSLVFGIFGTVFGYAFIGSMGGLLGAVVGLILGFIFNIKGGGNWGGWTGSGGSGFGGWFGGGGSNDSGFGGFGGGGSGGGGAGRSW